jgi:hypothetical protein
MLQEAALRTNTYFHGFPRIATASRAYYRMVAIVHLNGGHVSHIVALSEETFAALQALARPFVDTEESVIRALAEAELGRRSLSPNGRRTALMPARETPQIDVDSPENLTHTRIISAQVGGQPLHRPKWNSLVDQMHVLALKRLGSFDALRRASSANLREGRFEENGYKYLREGGFSIQGVDANLAWSHSLRLARAIPIPIDLRIEWRNKEGAARPGEQAVLGWSPAAHLKVSG